MVDKVREHGQTNVSGGGLKLFIFLSLIATVFFYLYMFVSLRYGPVLGKLSHSPLFTINDLWADFFNPIAYTLDRRPYEKEWGNAPPFLTFIAYILSFPLKMGLSRNALYLLYTCVTYMCGAWAICDLLKKYNEGFASRVLCLIVVFFGYPFMYSFDRGNFISLTAIVVIWFIWAYDRSNYYLAAVLLGLAAALKLHPAIFGVVFLRDKRIKEAAVCAATGITVSIGTLFFWHGGFVWNLKTFLQKFYSYTKVGNERLACLVDDKNSFYQLILVPKMLSDDPLTDISQVTEYVQYFKVAITIFMFAVIIVAVCGLKFHDIVLVSAMFCLGYPIESAVYGLTIAVFPVTYWCIREEDNRVIPILGAFLFLMKSCFVLKYNEMSDTTLQALLNPICELLIIAYIIWLRRKDIKRRVTSFRGGLSS